MKLATLADGSRDGQLVVVSRDLSQAHLASHIAGTLRHLLDDWNFISPQLEDLYALLNGGKQRHAFAFEPQACLAPLPRAHLFATDAGLARSDQFLRPVGAVSPARLGAAGPASTVGGPESDLAMPPAQWVAHWLALTGDVAAGADEDAGLDGVRLLLLAATWGPADANQASAQGAACSTAFAPVAVTPDELADHWQGGHVRVPLTLKLTPAANAQPQSDGQGAQTLSAPAAGFGRRIAVLARHQGLGAGSLVAGPPLATGAGWALGSQLHVQAGHGGLLGAIALHAA